MHTLEVKPEGREEPWRDGLLAVEACPVCMETSRDLLYGALSDRVFFCAPGEWSLWRCRRCRCAYLDPRLSPERIGLAYSRYYTHAQGDGVETEAPQSRLGRPGRVLSQGYLNARYGTALQPASPLGCWVLPLFPPRRLGLDHSVRHLRRPDAPARLLDLGCGNGSFLARMRRLGWEHSKNIKIGGVQGKGYSRLVNEPTPSVPANDPNLPDDPEF